LESNNYSGSNHGTGTYGAGFDWIPSVRTQASAFAEKRAFGNSHNFSLQHRTPRTVWRYRDNKDVTTTPNQLATVRSGTAFDLLFDALASQFPDPVLRGQEVQRRLQQSGTPADLIVPRTFLTTQVFQQRSREASVGLLGVRNTVTFTAVVTDGEAITPGAATARSGDFALAQNIRSRGITADWGHRLSPLSSLNVLASHVHSTAASASNLDSTQSMLRVALSHQLGRRTSASIGARMVRFDGSGTTPDYREKALTASVAVIF
jgi:uncharacterized protein (PEP-CTERM system associated)